MRTEHCNVNDLEHVGGFADKCPREQEIKSKFPKALKSYIPQHSSKFCFIFKMGIE